MLWVEPLMKGPGLIVDSRSFVETASAIMISLQSSCPIGLFHTSHSRA